MSEKREKRVRLNAKIEWIRNFERWLAEEPRMFQIFKRRKWKKRRPSYEEYLKIDTLVVGQKISLLLLTSHFA